MAVSVMFQTRPSVSDYLRTNVELRIHASCWGKEIHKQSILIDSQSVSFPLLFSEWIGNMHSQNQCPRFRILVVLLKVLFKEL